MDKQKYSPPSLQEPSELDSILDAIVGDAIAASEGVIGPIRNISVGTSEVSAVVLRQFRTQLLVHLRNGNEQALASFCDALEKFRSAEQESTG